jgi:hypothetical protein
MKGHGSKFGRKMEAAIGAFMREKSLVEAAKVAGISVSTLKRWLQMPEFQAELMRERRELVSQTNARIQYYSGAAASVAFKLMADASTPSSVRAHLSLALIDRANEAVDREDILVRLAALERAQEETKNRR